MKSKKKHDVLKDSYDSLKKLFSTDKTLVEIFDMMLTMTNSFIEKLISRKKHFKKDLKETGEKLRSELQNLETQLFTTKIETETLKIDKKYFEDQVSELQKKHLEMMSNIENIMTDPKKSFLS